MLALQLALSSGFPSTTLPIKELGFFGEMADSKAKAYSNKAKIYKMSRGHLTVSSSKDVLKQDEDFFKEKEPACRNSR